MTVHGPTELLDMETHKLALKASRAAAVICISDFARSQVASLLPGAGRDHLHTVRCGIDTTAFRPVPREGDAGGTPTILCVAALSPRKGHDVLIGALRRLHDTGLTAHLTLVGDGPERGALDAQAAALGLADHVTFAGAVGHDRVPAFYASADVFCLPSFAEGVPTVLMEAMATELPVVATDVMGVPELVEHERSGLLVRPARADLLADALARLLSDAELRRGLGREGRVRVEREYERTRSVAALRAALAPLLRVSR
jgi:glycosyltransferase involved in cell wall biosynthesis